MNLFVGYQLCQSDTFSHHDHIEAINYYRNAIIRIQRSEYVAAKKYIPTSFEVHLIDFEK